MATRLEDLIIDRVDLVDRGANPHAHILLYKREVPRQMVVADALVGELRLRKADSRGHGRSVIVENRFDPQSWARALEPFLQYGGGELYVNLAQKHGLKASVILQLARELPLTCKRYVYLPPYTGAPSIVAFSGQTIDQTHNAAERYIAKARDERNPMLTAMPPVVIEKALLGGRAELAMCRSAFETEVANFDGRLSIEEQIELGIVDPHGAMTAPERALTVVTKRFPALAEAYAAAVGRGCR